MRIAILFVISVFLIVSLDHGVRIESLPPTKSEFARIELKNPPVSSPVSPSIIFRRITNGETSTTAAARAMDQAEHELKGIGKLLNQTLILPHDLYVTLSDCGSTDSFYNIEEREIVVCQEMLNEFRELLSRESKSQPELQRAVVGATTFFFFHEVGHALVSGWDLPVTGREEDAVDQFSAVMLLGIPVKGEEMVLNGANIFRLSASSASRKFNPTFYWEDHSQDEQRYFDTVCLLYGKHPEKYAYLVSTGMLPGARAMNCEEDFVRIDRSWRTLLGPHLKTPLANPLAKVLSAE